MTEKTLVGLLSKLNEFNEANIKYLSRIDVDPPDIGEYKDEMAQIQDLINSFEFVRYPKMNKLLLTHPIPKELKND